MTCEEFEAIGLDAGLDASLTDAQRATADQHALSCARCAALRDSWQAVRVELRALAQQTATAEAPQRVEMRVRQQFHTQHRTLKTHRRAVVAGWALAAAAVLVGAVSWVQWRSNQTRNRSGNSSANAGTAVTNHDSAQERAAGSSTLVADNELGDFTLLPGVSPGDTEDAAILRVRMQRGALGALGLPVNEDRAAEWIQVDLMVGNDGLPEAVRLLGQETHP
jgi:anti-sigma factor RsiW